MADELPEILKDANASITTLLATLRAEAERLRTRHTAAAAESRQKRRALDELAVQRSFAEQLNTGGLERLREQENAIRSQIGGLDTQVANTAEAIKRLEQLIHQTEMSSTTLAGAAQMADRDDPWALALRGQIIHGREEERVRLAREVHDGPAQVLANVLMGLEHAINLQASASPRLGDFLAELRGAARQGLQEVRGFIADLRPGALEDGVPAALAAYIGPYQRNTGVNVTLDLADWPARLSKEAEVVLYRATQEALQNINKHARRAEVFIRSTIQGQQLTLTIRDNGPGFDPREVMRRSGKVSWGLTSMRERLQLVGGDFAIASRPGAGTEVTLRVPL